MQAQSYLVGIVSALNVIQSVLPTITDFSDHGGTLYLQMPFIPDLSITKKTSARGSTIIVMQPDVQTTKRV